MKNVKEQLATLLTKEMDRKDFLKHLAAAGFMVAGGGVLLQSVGGINKLATGKQDAQVAAARNSGYGYGSSPYGGRQVAS